MHRTLTLLWTLVLLVGLPPTSRHRADAQVPVPIPKTTDPDSDGDSLSDFQKVHKYFIDPHKKSSASKNGSEGDWDERREFTYSVRSVIRIMPPYNLAAMKDDYQDTRVLSQTKDYAELEVVSYPLNTNGEAISANANWRQDYAGMKDYLQPGVTTNWDDGLRKDLLAELVKDSIDVARLTDKEVVGKVSRWVLGRCSYKRMFCTMFVDFPGGKATILPGLEQAFQREKGDGKWTNEEQLAHEVFGREMFYHRTRGSCTSSAVLLTTVLRALGIPTRMIVAIPIADANDPEQLALVEKGLRHHEVRAKVTSGLRRLGQGFANHTYNEVFVGNRWRRLNYQQLGQNILDEQFFGLMVHVHTFNDLSEAHLAPTWGRRYALGLRDENFKTGNPYRTLEISDHFGRESKVPNPPFEQKEHKSITITKIYWLNSEATNEQIRQGAPKATEGEGQLLIHGEEWFPEQDHVQYREFMTRVDKDFVLHAEGHPDVKAKINAPYGAFWTSSHDSLREILVVIPKDELVKMAKGVAYMIRPINSVAAYKWKVKEGLTIARPLSVEEKFDALQRRFDQLEKRLEALEKERAVRERR